MKTSSELEKGPTITDGCATTNAAAREETILVTWDGSSDPSNPYNWPSSRKWFTTLLTSLGGLITLMSGPMLAPALDVLGKDLHISQAEASIVLSIYILAFAFGPMVLAPCSEVWGRRPIWIIGTCWYVLWNTLCGFSTNRALLITGRLMSGLGASAEFAVSGAIVADCFTSDERGKSTAVRSFLPLLGPAIGPIVGGVMVQHTSWRWLFYVLSIFAGCLAVAFLLFLPETHAPTLLSRKAAHLRKTTGKPYYSEKDVSNMTVVARLKITTLRPAMMLCRQPVIQLAAFLMGYQFGLLYIVHSTFANMWLDKYHQSHTASGLHYFAPVTGCLIALLIQWWAIDAIWAWLKARNGGLTKPENRVPLMIPGSLLIPIGLLVYGWAVEKRTHWIVPDLGKNLTTYTATGKVNMTVRYGNLRVWIFAEYHGHANLYCRSIPGIHGIGHCRIPASQKRFRFRVPYICARFVLFTRLWVREHSSCEHCNCPWHSGSLSYLEIWGETENAGQGNRCIGMRGMIT